MLRPVHADPDRDHAQVVGEVHPSTINATRSSPDRSADSSSASAVSVAATNRRVTAERDVDVAVSVTASPTGSSPAR
jgi:hypothetical protein